MKVYVQEKKEKTVDNDELQVINVYMSKPNDFTFLIFIEK